MFMIATSLFAAALASAPAPVQASKTPPIGIVETPAKQPVRHSITIVSAFSCPYCRVLDQQAMAELRSYWGPRGLRIETVPFILSPTDLAANIAVTCGPASGYARRSTILFRAQPEILGNWRSSPEEARKRAQAMPNGSGAPAIARLSGLLEIAPSLGLTVKQLQACLNDPARQKRPEQRQRQADARWKIVGTPTVLIDGKVVSGPWAEIRRTLVTTMGS